MFSVTLPPENSQKSLQLMNLYGSNGLELRPLRNRFQSTFAAVQSEGTGRTHCHFPFGVLRLIHDSTCVILPAIPCLTHARASETVPELSCCNPICTTRSDFRAASRHATASSMDQVMVFSLYKSLFAAIVSIKWRAWQ